MKKLELVIFDWAGTTVDYGCFAPVRAFLEVFRHFGMEPAMAEVREPMGMLKRDHIKTMLAMPTIQKSWVEKHKKASTEADVDAMYQLFERKLMNVLTEYCDIKPDVPEVVKILRKMGVSIGSTTGYTDEMMSIVTKTAKENGYEPDAWYSPNSVGNLGRPYPYMIYRNMEYFQVHSVENVIKIGDTISDIKEGKHAGVYSIGVIEGSSEMGLTRAEYEILSSREKSVAIENTKTKFLNAGADAVILNMGELLKLI